MFDYISAIYYGDDLSLRQESPLKKPTDLIDHTVLRQLGQVKAAMGREFYDKLYGDLCVLLERRQAAAFHTGAHTGAHLMLALLDHES